MKGKGLFRSFDPGAIPCERAEDDRVFKSFALVDGYEFDGIIIAFQAQLIFLNQLKSIKCI